MHTVFDCSNTIKNNAEGRGNPEVKHSRTAVKTPTRQAPPDMNVRGKIQEAEQEQESKQLRQEILVAGASGER